ncbi:MAG: capsular biosynthesis protein [Candidatus Omnitrophica bacterium CG11_big_fil_rev_8_21_14_0_20_63_9]|nr:MAG: capsular biosynthesis protein [Candidatus Omnitrophica bacterium CG11_big_fil_rev_8_21_14_0_20_63_9]
MSKITKALEKAARERLHKLQEHANVRSEAVEIPIETPSRISEAMAAGRVHIDPHIVAATDSSSPIAEQYRILRTNLQSLRLRPGPKTIVVTSSVHSEGKSVTSINLALTLARQENLRVVLVDADLRKGSINKWMGLGERAEGLSTALLRGGELNGSLLKLKDPALAVLPCGDYPEHPAELLESSSMKKVLAGLREQFDVIVIDAPPVLPVADPGILAAQADGVLLVVRAGKTQRKTVLQAQSLLRQMKANVLGCVLTHVEYYLPGYYRYYHQYRYGVVKDKDGNGKAAAGSPAQPEAQSSTPQT